ncbi:hypothetical protein SISSUDRAFT_1118854 [Sistotremastrum suecicum HHB10207 ss-3]|uniref:Uncharacterized protein n=1 Tax=Sistotremastrum suecicum HHB10207 ss-3 TaxID=1314776 RepID=A0A166EJF7_9AGAM|nr:hypothetical protein SISSUDRAFT_1118854 [Sistotremastrum suecicum HHB10207 ss-3]
MLAILRMSCRPDHLLALRKYATTKAPYLTSRSPLTSQRDIHTTPRTAAQHSTNPLVNSPLMQKLQNSPEALSAISNMLDIMRQEGFDTTSGRQPSTMQMLKLFTNARVVAELDNVKEALTKAGIEINQETAMEVLKSMREIDESKK